MYNSMKTNMLIVRSKWLKYGVQLAFLMSPLLLRAQGTGDIPIKAPPAPVTSLRQVYTVIFCGAYQWLFLFAIVGSIVLGIIAAYNYLLAAGNPENTAKGRKMLQYAAVAVVIAILARGLPFVIADFFNRGFGISEICA